MHKHLGVRLVHKEMASPGETVQATVDALSSLPRTLRAALEDGLCRLDTLAVAKAIEQVADAQLARALSIMANEFQYGRLLQLIRATNGDEEQ